MGAGNTHTSHAMIYKGYIKACFTAHVCDSIIANRARNVKRGNPNISWISLFFYIVLALSRKQALKTTMPLHPWYVARQRGVFFVMQ